MTERDTYKVPVWTDQDGNEWTYEPCWEQCVFGCDASWDFVGEPLEVLCYDPVEYISPKTSKGLCGKHFEEIKARCKVHYEEFS